MSFTMSQYLILWAAICACLFITPTQQQQQQQQQQNIDQNEKAKPMYSLDLGPVTVEKFFNYTEYKDKLRLKKGYMKYVIGRKQMDGSTSPLSTFKISFVEELVRCENLTLDDAGMLPHINCSPLEFLVSEGSSLSSDSGNKLYTRRRSAQIKQKITLRGSMVNSKRIGYMYDLKPEYVSQMLSDKLASLNSTSSPLSASTLGSFGHYTELRNIVNEGFSCSGSFLYALDESKLLPLGELDMIKILEFIVKHGGLFSIPNYTCRTQMVSLLSSISTSITLAWQPEQFPYLTVKHDISTSPLKEIWKYSGSITQQRNETSALGSGSKPQAYKTTVEIISRSLFRPLFFSLNQIFAHTNKHEGWEEMIMSQPSFMAIVSGVWTPDSLVKYMLLSSSVNEKDSKKWPAIKFEYNDTPDNDEIMFIFKMNRKFWAKWMADEDEDEQHRGGWKNESWNGAHEEL